MTLKENMKKAIEKLKDPKERIEISIIYDMEHEEEEEA